jgi:hypothetical protein
MKRLALLLIILSAAAHLTGCVKRPTPQDSEGIFWGPAPLDYEERIKDFMSQSLFDPYSAQYECGKPCKAGTIVSPFNNKHDFGWLVQCRINAKNRFGGYTGKQNYGFYISLMNIVRLNQSPPAICLGIKD